jgi:peptide/nickel transport system substrate-binding protein
MRVSRRAFVAGTGMALAGAQVTPPLLTRAKAQGTDTLRLGWGARGLRTIDPHKSIQGVDEWAINHIHDKLVRMPLGRFPTTLDEIEPGLATAWESSPDSKTWTFTLREGVQFHKGFGEFTSADVKFSFDRVRDADRIGVRRPMYDNIDEVEVDGPYKVIFHLEDPDPLFLLSAQSHHSCCIMSMKAVEEKGDEGIDRDAIGTGPYVLDTVHEDPSEGVTLVANPDHWAGPPATPRIQCTYIADTTARTLAILSGDVHMIEGVRAPGWVPSIQQRDPSLHFDVVSPGSFFSIHINLTHPPFDDVRVRQAVFYAIDRDEITQAMFPFGGRTWSLNPPSYIGGFDGETIPEEVRYDYSQEKARELLAEAGHPNGFSFNAYTSQREDYSSIMLMVQEQLRKVGINMELEIKDHTAFHADQATGTNTLSQNSSTFAPVPTQAILLWLTAGASVIEGGGGGSNFSRYGKAIPGIDDLFEQAMQEPDLEKRITIVQQIEIKHLTDAPLLPVVTNGFLVVRAANVDIGYEVVSGYANWDLTKTVIS